MNNLFGEFKITPEVKEWLNKTFDCRWGENCDLLLKTKKYWYPLNGRDLGMNLTIPEMKERLRRMFTSKVQGTDDKWAVKQLEK